MPSYTEEQKRKAVETVEECGGSVTRAIRRLGYPSRQTMYQWLNQRDASHERRAGRPWSHYDPELKAQAVSFVRSGMAAGDVAEMLGVSSATVVYNWARAAESPCPASADRRPIAPMRDSEERAYDGFEGSLEDRVRQLELENDILRAVAKVLKAESPSPMTNREKALVINELRATTGRSLKELTASLRISKSSYEYQRRALARPDKHAGLRVRVREIFEGANGSRGYRYVAHELRSGEDPIVVSEKVVRRVMREEGLVVVYAKKKAGYSSYKGEISDAPENLVRRDFHAAAPNELWLTDITEFGLPDGKVYLSPILDCFDGGLAAWSIGTSPSAELANSSLEAACGKLSEGQRPVTHSDRGCHYRWPGWIAICEKNLLVRSMSKKGCSPDNSAMEGFFGRLKNEFFHHRDWSGVSIPEFCRMLDSYLRYYNEGRPKEGLGWMSPMQYRRSLGLAA